MVLIREKLSKLTETVTLKQSIIMTLVNTASETAEFKPYQFRENSIELKKTMDPAHLAEQAVGLNLKLMKWRMAPDLNLEVCKGAKCLLLGSGSLGCQVARNLLSWGYEHITFVDSGKVSYSNPVRQCLFTFADSQADDNFKAPIAATRLKEVYPMVKSQGHVLTIPMPGHAVADNDE